MPPTSRFVSQPRVVLPGSEKQPFRISITPLRAPHISSFEAGDEDPVTVSVLVRPGRSLVPDIGSAGVVRLSRAEYALQYGPDAASIGMVEAFAREFGLGFERKPEEGRCTVALSGTIAQMETAFGVSLKRHRAEGVNFRVREGAIFLPEELSGHVLAVLGLDNRPQAKAHFVIANPLAVSTSYTPVQVGQLYGFPVDATAPGQTIGLIELGGGFLQADVDAYFATLGLPSPLVTAVSVDGGQNAPSTPNGADGEVMLDIEVSAAVAAGAKIAVYFAPNTDQGFIDAISTAVHDSVNKPSVISISWGGPESSWTMQAMTALDAACQAAAVLGVTITAACGDNGSSDGVAGGASVVDFPSSSPHVLACGGTRLTGSGSQIASEVVWNETVTGSGATGGGVSAVFALPTWQSGAGVPASSTATGGRGVPDVAGDADPATGYQVRVDGQTLVIGGTSAVAPLWAGLIALANEQNKVSAGFANPVLYRSAGAFRDITEGNNGAFHAGPGWDACTGLGTPMGTAVIAALAPAAGASGAGAAGLGAAGSGGMDVYDE